MSNFHCHSEYSVRDSIAKVGDIANKMKFLGKKYFCITDHGSMASFAQAEEEAKARDMKFYAGCEFYVVPEGENDAKRNATEVAELTKVMKRKTSSKEEKEAASNRIQYLKSQEYAYYHLTVLAYNFQGLLNLFKINNNGDFYYKNRVHLDDIKKYNEGLIVLSGCPAGELLRMIENDHMDKADKWLKDMKAVFSDRLYYELMYHDGVYEVANQEHEISEIVNIGHEPEFNEVWVQTAKDNMSHQEPFDDSKYKLTFERHEMYDPGCPSIIKFTIRYKYTDEYWTKLRCDREKEIYIKGIELARKNNVKIVASNDSHYVDPKDRRYWLITRMAMIGNDKEFIGDYNMLSDNSMFEEVYRGYVTKDELDVSEKEIEDRLESYDLPHSNYKSAREDESYFERLVWTGFKKKRIGTEYEEEALLAIPYELSVIQTKGFGKYFLKTREIVKAANEVGMLVGPGRGSGAGSECTFDVDITQTDPLKYGLMFERFLNSGREAMPDIDLDLQSFVCQNFKPDEEYKKMFFSTEVELVSDNEIRSYWERWKVLSKQVEDKRRQIVFDQSPNATYFEGPIFDQPLDIIKVKDR